MKCINPVLKANLGKKILFRHWNLASSIVKQTGIPYDCGQCIHCRKKKAKELARRCVLHASMYTHNCFITLTYNESYVGDNRINYSDIQKFKKRLRRSLAPKKIEIFNVHEYGKNGRKHWHLVIFNHDFEDKQTYSTSQGISIYNSNTLSKLWSYGYNTIGTVTEASAMYQSQYTQKDIINGNTNNEKKAKSNHSGIGKPFFDKHYKQILTLGYIPFGEQKMPIPRYFEKLAHKHYCHFYDTSAFFKTDTRKEPLYRPFKQGEENHQIAELYIKYKEHKNALIEEKSEDWIKTINTYIETKYKPDFVKAGENTLREMQTKQLTKKEKF